jgi:hypothetical protein
MTQISQLLRRGAAEQEPASLCAVDKPFGQGRSVN